MIKEPAYNQNWFIQKSTHYVFHFLFSSIVEKEIKNIIKEQEKWYSLITKKLKIKNSRKINYYLYPSRALKEKLTGNSGNAHTNWDDFSVHAIYSKNLKVIGPHEDTHLLTLKWGISIGFLREGLAEYLHSDWHGKSHNYWAQKYKKENKFEFEKLFDNDYFYSLNPNISYPLAGSFVKYLINKFGLEKFKKIYGFLSADKKNDENLRLFERNYNLSLITIKEERYKKINK